MDRLQRLDIFFSPPTMSSTIEILPSAFCFSWITLPAEFIAQQGSHNALHGTRCICYSGEAIDSQKFTIRRQSRPSFELPNPNAPAAHILPFTGKADSSKSAVYLHLLRKGNHVNRVHGLKPVTPVAGDQGFVTDLEFGTQLFQTQVDTESSEKRLVGQGFECADDSTGAHDKKCMFGPTYTVSSTFKHTPNEHFQAVYGDGSIVTEIVGNELATIDGLTVQDLEVTKLREKPR